MPGAQLIAHDPKLIPPGIDLTIHNHIALESKVFTHVEHTEMPKASLLLGGQAISFWMAGHGNYFYVFQGDSAKGDLTMKQMCRDLSAPAETDSKGRGLID